jgi:hypothetical protein
MRYTSGQQWLSVVGVALPAAFPGAPQGAQLQLQATDDLDAAIVGVFDATTVLTGLDYQIVTSEDGVNWDAIQTTRSDTGATQATHTLVAQAGGTVHARLQTNSHRTAAFVAIQVRASAGSGAAKAGDSAASTAKYSALR